MAAPSVFTIEAANALIPRLQGLMEAQMGRRGEIEKLLERLSQRLGKTPEAIQDDPADPDDVRELKRDIIGRVERYHAAWSELEEMGAVLKDPRTGLVDFYGRVDGKLVWLCWKYGEKQVTHYHGLDEGFSGRKPIEQTMRTRHLN
jgi:hypothetical protein